MVEYTPQTDAYIAQQLRLRGTVSAAQIPGATPEDGRRLLQEFIRRNPDQQYFLDGDDLKTGIGTEPAVQPAASETIGFQDSIAETGTSVPTPIAPTPPAAGDPSSGYGQSGPGGGGYAAGPSNTGGYGTPMHMSPETPQRVRVSGWLWLLPILFSLLGGIVAWALARDKDPKAARNMLIAGIVIFALSLCSWFGFGLLISSSVSGGATGMAGDSVWPANGQLTFYYFGSPG